MKKTVKLLIKIALYKGSDPQRMLEAVCAHEALLALLL
jgi:hypothetical protein